MMRAHPFVHAGVLLAVCAMVYTIAGLAQAGENASQAEAAPDAEEPTRRSWNPPRTRRISQPVGTSVRPVSLEDELQLGIYPDDMPLEPVPSCNDSCVDAVRAGFCCPAYTFAMIEWTYFAYHRADGSRVGGGAPGEDVQADFHSSLRYTAGYMGDSGLGIRTRYWRFGHSSPSEDAEAGRVRAIEALNLAAYNFDLELFETIELNCNWTLEVSGGVRYTEFEELMVDDEGTNNVELRLNASDSFGGIGGLEARRCFWSGSLYLGFRTSILMGNDAVRSNAGVMNVALQDVPRQQFEIFGGWEYEECLGNAVVFFRAGAEWQHWMNFSSAFNGTNEDVWDGESNVGFGGVVVGAGLFY